MSVFDRLQKILKEYMPSDDFEITPDTEFLTDLGLNSYEIALLICDIEDEFGIEEGIPEREMQSIKTVRDVLNYLEHDHSVHLVRN